MSRRLRILHLFANFKWTGPADPAIRTAHALREAGADVVFAQAEFVLPDAEHWMRPKLQRWRLPVIAGMQLRKHFHPPSLLADARALRARLTRGDFDLLHCHLLGDHMIAALARRRVKRRVKIVRTIYDPWPPKRGWRQRLAFRATDGVVAPTRRCAAEVSERFGLPPHRVLYQEPVTEPRPATDRDAGRVLLGLGPDDFAIGITARIQPHRKFETLWAAARQVVAAEPRTRIVLLGRGNAEDTQRLVRQPVAELGLESRVVTPGYLEEPAYGHALQALDLFAFMVPGSDGTCRAVREAMALGLAVVTTRRGMLPDLLDVADESHPPCGIVSEDDPDSLAQAMLRLIRDPSTRRAMGDASATKAWVRMHPARGAEALLAFYETLMGDA